MLLQIVFPVFPGRTPPQRVPTETPGLRIPRLGGGRVIVGRETTTGEGIEKAAASISRGFATKQAKELAEAQAVLADPTLQGKQVKELPPEDQEVIREASKRVTGRELGAEDFIGGLEARIQHLSSRAIEPVLANPNDPRSQAILSGQLAQFAGAAPGTPLEAFQLRRQAAISGQEGFDLLSPEGKQLAGMEATLSASLPNELLERDMTSQERQLVAEMALKALNDPDSDFFKFLAANDISAGSYLAFVRNTGSQMTAIILNEQAARREVPRTIAAENRATAARLKEIETLDVYDTGRELRAANIADIAAFRNERIAIQAEVRAEGRTIRAIKDVQRRDIELSQLQVATGISGVTGVPVKDLMDAYRFRTPDGDFPQIKDDVPPRLRIAWEAIEQIAAMQMQELLPSIIDTEEFKMIEQMLRLFNIADPIANKDIAISLGNAIANMQATAMAKRDIPNFESLSPDERSAAIQTIIDSHQTFSFATAIKIFGANQIRERGSEDRATQARIAEMQALQELLRQRLQEGEPPR